MRPKELGRPIVVEGPQLHRQSERVDVNFVRVRSDKHRTPLGECVNAIHLTHAAKLLELIDQDTQQGRTTIVFCNTLASARSTAWVIENHGVPVSNLHSGVPPLVRHILAAFPP